ncbi:MAG: hypothetical protein ACI89L_001914 [Phycisphaerales bacterium]|jgi:hypothetical protein
MLVLKPRQVAFDGDTWGNVSSVAISRTAETMVVEWSDDGPHVVMADVPEQRVSVELVQSLLGEDMDEPKPGRMGTLSFETGSSSTDATTDTVSMTAVIERVWYEVSVSRGSSRRVRLVAVSSDGTADPVTVS